MSAGNSLRIPHFLSASSPKGLMRSMLKNNLRHGKEFVYSTPALYNSKWIVWFNLETAMVSNLSQSVNKGDQ